MQYTCAQCYVYIPVSELVSCTFPICLTRNVDEPHPQPCYTVPSIMSTSSENFKVAVRVRPLIARETASGTTQVCPHSYLQNTHDVVVGLH